MAPYFRRMKNILDIKIKSYNYKLKMQSKQLLAVQALIKRANGYAKTQAEASEKRLIIEIEELNKNIKSLSAK